MSWEDGWWMEAAWDWDICKEKMSSMPQKMLGELVRMALNRARIEWIKLSWGLGVSIALLWFWGAIFGDGGL